MVFGEEEKKKFEEATTCWICEGGFNPDEKKVRDHCHFTGKFRGAAHNKCNLDFRKPTFTPVFFHNLSGYDAHLFVKNLGLFEGEITCLPNNEEKYISFSKKILLGTRKKGDKIQKIWHEIRFLDSAKFMASKLKDLVKDLTDDDFHETKAVFGEKTNLMKRKGIFPYEWLTTVEKFKCENLPSKEEFFSRFHEEGISQDDHDFAKKIWQEFQIKNMGEFHDKYLLADVTLLADVIQEFRKVCRKHYDLDPPWFFTSPGLAWEAALKESDVFIDLLTDPDMLLFFERGIRGGISTIFHRHAKANNKFMADDFDPTKPSKFISYVDANGLYAWAMTNPLPVRNFQWMTDDELQRWEEKEEHIGCVLEVDVEIPDELHDHFNDFPPLPERINMNGVDKLIPNLQNKTMKKH